MILQYGAANENTKQTSALGTLPANVARADKGKALMADTDYFSLGVMLYEMTTAKSRLAAMDIATILTTSQRRAVQPTIR